MNIFDRQLFDRIEKAESDADRAQTGATRSQAETDVLKVHLERLSMITEALWTILKEKHGYGDEELMKRITEIDLRDGKLDGHAVSSETPVCPQCKRMHIAKHRPICLYCGATISVQPFSL